jgi:acyl-coenzyme A thioesterase PaaI-like protein
MTAQKWNDEQWTQYLTHVLASNRFPRFVGVRLDYVKDTKACVFVEWRDDLGQLEQNPIYNGGVPTTLADQAACISVVPQFGNINVVTEELHYKFSKAAPAEHRLYAAARRTSFNTNPHKPGDLRLKGATVDVDVFVKDYNDQQEYIVGTCVVRLIWIGGPALNA